MLLEDKTLLKNMKKSCWNSFIASFLLIMFAVVLLINPENFLQIAINVFGYIAVFMGVLNLVFYFRIPEEQKILSRNFGNGLLLIIFGIISFVETAIIKEIVTLLIGGYLIFRNVDRANLSMNLKGYTNKLWIYCLVISFINVILGVCIMINPFEAQMNTLIASLIIVSEALITVQNILILIGLRSREHHEEN